MSRPARSTLRRAARPFALRAFAARALTLCALVVCASGPAAAFDGQVVRQDGQAVADAIISIVGRAGTVRTDPEGRFTWQPDPPLPFEIVIVLPGGRSLPPRRVEELPAPPDPLRVTIAPQDLEPVLVTVEAAPHILAPPAAAATRLTHDDLEQRHPARLTDALENIPGASRLDGIHDAVPSLRGMARGRTLLLIDGARVTTERRAGASAGFLDPFFLEAIEVTRGPGSVAYGSDALGGIVHSRTRMVDPGSPPRLRFTASGGVGIPQGSGGIEYSRGLEEGGYLLQGRYRAIGDYDAPDGEIPNSSVQDGGFLGRFQHEMGPGRMAAGLQVDRVRDLEQPSTSPTTVSTRPEENSTRFTASHDFDPTASGLLAGVEAFAGTYQLITQQELTPTGQPARTVASDVSAFDYGVRAHAGRGLGPARVEGGVDLNGRSNLEARTSDSIDGDARAIQDASRLDAGLYATGDVPLGSSWSASAGVRYDHVATRARGVAEADDGTTHGAWSGHASITAGPFDGWSVTGQASRGFRDPTLSDRYYTGPSGRGFVTGNPDLEPERSDQYDLAVRYSGSAWHAAAYTYDYRIEDLVVRTQEGVDPITGQDLFVFGNAGEATWRGVELEIGAEFRGKLSIELAAQAARGETEEGEPIDDVPVRNATLMLRQKAGERGSLLARAAVYARDDRPGPTEIETPSFATLDLGGGWRPVPDLELRLMVRNVFDRAHPSSPDARATDAPGRSALFSVVASLGD